MRDYKTELEMRVLFIQNMLQDAGADGIVYGNSGGKDCTLVSILCKKACDNVLGVIMPCQSARNYSIDKDDATIVAEQYGIETIMVDLSTVKKELLETIGRASSITDMANANIAPRLRMTTLYTIAQTRNSLVAGTGNRSEGYMGYFTKWGDGAHDFNPIGDLTVTEVYEFLEYLGAPQAIITKAPSAGLFDGQTDEGEMGVTYRQIDDFILKGSTDAVAEEKIKKAHAVAEHKRSMPVVYQH